MKAKASTSSIGPSKTEEPCRDAAAEQRDEFLCRYKFGKCMNPRTYKINGALHSLCTMHRMRQNAHQLKSDRKRRQTRKTSLPSSFDMASPDNTRATDSVARSSAIGETICVINASLLKLTRLLLEQDEISRAEGCSVLLSLNPSVDTRGAATPSMHAPIVPLQWGISPTSPSSTDTNGHFDTLPPFEFPPFQPPPPKALHPPAATAMSPSSSFLPPLTSYLRQRRDGPCVGTAAVAL
ncbi:Aste57867_25478 [Aphanomyces stellatus]|uniref:Aste57867_25478 protein n=1 Tax=Aphanomyces stellatus TaxID=120398 RepID=A0A485LTB1_9STRA|nr:hypothetical protein As57867_025399 [Aphanomyces stellatus]VFU02101.1 Aste57867_25478 [Aphanomyces stellatus]